MADAFELTEEIRAAIGVESEPWPYEVTSTGIRAFARGVGYDDPVYYDADAARAAGYDGLPAPPAYLGTPVFMPGRSDAVFSGPPGVGPRPRYGLEHVLDGGTEVLYERRPIAGETLMATDKLIELEVKQSRSLGTMLVVATEATFRDAAGELVARERSHYIFY
jgi:N-terminal half of MaoC dehydratase